MNIKKILITIFMALCLQTAIAQKVCISPTPQQQTWGKKAFSQSEASFKIIGTETADKDALRVLRSSVRTNGTRELIIGKRGDDCVENFEKNIPSKAEGYYLKVSPDKVIIAGNDEVGTFYGVQTLLQVLSQPEVMQTEITDYPMVSDRGVIEGFYGNPWSERDRKSQYEFYGQNKMNIYIYGPKDDPYHRAKWRKPYPEKEGQEITRLVEAAHKNKVRFVWALHPGCDIHWGDTDRDNVIKKLEAMYKLGVRTFAIFFDDIGGEGANGKKQSELLNYVQQHFVEKHSDVADLILCPTVYNQAWSGDGSYLRALKQYLSKRVRIMWTGASVVRMIKANDCDWFYNQTGRYPYIWLNYPVTDYCARHLLMGPTFGNDLTIAPKLAGFTSNPMEYAEASKVSLYSIADYIWNLKSYDANASWHRAIRALMPKHTKAFQIFCENNVDLGSNTHGLRRQEGESPKFRPIIKLYNEAKTEDKKAEASALLDLQFDSLIWSSNQLIEANEKAKKQHDTSLNTYLIDEITPWLQVMKIIGERGKDVLKMQQLLKDKNPEEFVEVYLHSQELEEMQKSIRSRDFEGSIKRPNPVVADVVVVPFIKQTLAALVKEYKKHFDYRLDVFPAQILEDGNYYIIYKGHYLSNNNKNGHGGNPSFSATEPSRINPELQEWTISRDANTGRYSIINAYDNRYINELGNFGTNPYENDWHTFSLYRFNGKYAIQNGGSAKTNFWKINNQRIQNDDKKNLDYSLFFFEIVPVDKTKRVKHPMIEANKKYFIINKEGKFLTNKRPSTSQKKDFPMFSPRLARDRRGKQKWRWVYVKTVGRYALQNMADGRFVNEFGNFCWNPYTPDWNTYYLTEVGGKFAIQNAGNSGDKYWQISDGRCSQGTNTPEYVFKIVDTEDPSVNSISTPSKENLAFNISKDSIDVTENVTIQELSLLSIDGKKIKHTAEAHLSLSDLPAGAYIVSLTTDSQTIKEKLCITH